MADNVIIGDETFRLHVVALAHDAKAVREQLGQLGKYPGDEEFPSSAEQDLAQRQYDERRRDIEEELARLAESMAASVERVVPWLVENVGDGVNPPPAVLRADNVGRLKAHYSPGEFEVEPEDRFVAVHEWPRDGEYRLMGCKTLQDALDDLGAGVLDGWMPAAVYDLDTNERHTLHVATPVVSVSEDERAMESVLEDPVRWTFQGYDDDGEKVGGWVVRDALSEAEAANLLLGEDWIQRQGIVRLKLVAKDLRQEIRRRSQDD